MFYYKIYLVELKFMPFWDKGEIVSLERKIEECELLPCIATYPTSIPRQGRPDQYIYHQPLHH